MWLGQKQGDFRYSIRDAIPGQGLLDFLHDAGSYRQVRTGKVDFLTFPDFDYSRTRLIDDDWGYQWDRVVAYIKAPESFVVFDVFKALRPGYYTAAGLWHAQKIFTEGPHWFDVGYESIQKGRLPDDKRLLILFPHSHNRIEGTEPETRHFQEERLIHQTLSRHFELGATDVLVSVLIPHAAGDDPSPLTGRVSLLPGSPAGAAIGVDIRTADRDFVVGVKTDLRMDISRDWRRPRYTYEAGRIGLGDFETNGDFLFATVVGDSASYTIVNLTKALFKGDVLIDAPESLYGLAFDASPDRGGVGKLRYWRDKRMVK
jgi:hypothetical protein